MGSDSDSDYSPKKDYLKDSLQKNKGLEIPGDLENF